MIMRIYSDDFSIFAGARHKNPDNKELNKYLSAFKDNPDYTTLHITDRTGQMDFDIVCYIYEYLRSPTKNDIGMFTRIERDINGKIQNYLLGFYKK